DVQIPGRNRAWAKTQLYQAMPRSPRGATLVLRSPLPMATLKPQIGAAIHAANPHIKIGFVVDAERMLDNSRATHRLMLKLIGAFAAIAALLAAFGLHA